MRNKTSVASANLILKYFEVYLFISKMKSPSKYVNYSLSIHSDQIRTYFSNIDALVGETGFL